MQTSEQGLAVIRSFEGLSLKAYKDEVGVWTIGYGQTNSDAAVLGFPIKAGVTITRPQAESLLKASITRLYEPTVATVLGPIKRPPDLAQPTFDAGVSFVYNIGIGGFAKRTWVVALQQGNMAAVRTGITNYNHAGGKVLPGLTRRREREWAMISKGDYGPEGKLNAPVTDEKGKVIETAAPDKGKVIVNPLVQTPRTSGLWPWHARMESILGLYEFPGAANNPCILAMADQCGGNIKATYKNDATAWCALTVNWCLITTGYKGSGTLWALDFRKAPMVSLPGPCPGAIATKTRNGGGHVFIVAARTKAGKIIGTGGNQADMVCDEEFDPSILKFTWPAGVMVPRTGMDTLPMREARPHTHKTYGSLPAVETHPAIEAETNVRPKLAAEATRMANMKSELVTTTTTGGAIGGGTAAAQHASGGSLPLSVLVVAGIVALGLIAWTAWKYRDEIKAVLAAKYGAK